MIMFGLFFVLYKVQFEERSFNEEKKIFNINKSTGPINPLTTNFKYT